MLDYSIQSPQQRKKLVQKIINQTPPEKLTKKYLENMANYLIFAMTKEQRKNRQINTDNRMTTINKRQISFEGLITKFENGEDGIYNLIANNKNILLTPKISITKEDIESIPPLKELQSDISNIEQQLLHACGRRRFLLKKQLIQMRKDQYTIKTSYKPVTCINATKNIASFNFNNQIKIENDKIIDNGLISLFNPQHISALLCNYSKLKQECYGKFYADGYYLIQDLENLIDSSIKHKNPIYFYILTAKIDGLQNLTIQNNLYKKFNIKYSIQYISLLWRQKIPKLIAEAATQQYLEWYYTNKVKGVWKKCNKCNTIKLAHNLFFSKNNTSKDKFYSICKECRNKKKG